MTRKYIPDSSWTEYHDIDSYLHAYVRSLDGIGMLGHGMTAKRIRANP